MAVTNTDRDRRQLILTALLEVLSNLTITLQGGGLSDAPTVIDTAAGSIVHNRNELPEEKLPGLILLDADEVRDPRFPERSGRSSRPGPSMMKMTPEIYIVLDERKPPNYANVGEDLNTARKAILYAVMHDTNLQVLTGDNGTITYDGCITDLARNRTMKGQMGLSITFTYPLIPGELAST